MWKASAWRIGLESGQPYPTCIRARGARLRGGQAARDVEGQRLAQQQARRARERGVLLGVERGQQPLERQRQQGVLRQPQQRQAHPGPGPRSAWSATRAQAGRQRLAWQRQRQQRALQGMQQRRATYDVQVRAQRAQVVPVTRAARSSLRQAQASQNVQWCALTTPKPVSPPAATRGVACGWAPCT